MNSTVYDPEEASNSSEERLERVTPRYGPSEDKPPFEIGLISKGDHADPNYGQSKDQKLPQKCDQPNLGRGDGVLLNFLGDANYPDVVRNAIEKPLDSGPYHDDSPSPERSSHIKLEPPVRVPHGPSFLQERPLLPIPSHHQKHEKPPTLPGISTIQEPQHWFEKPKLRPISSKFPYDPKSPEDSLAASPLGRFAISPSDRPPQDQLPVIQSSPQSIGVGSPENPQSLPSIISTFGDLSHTTPSPFTPFSPMPSTSSQGGRNNDPLPLLSSLRPPNSQDLVNSSSRPSSWSPSKAKKPDGEYLGSPYDPSRKSPPANSPSAAAYPTPMEYKSAGEPDQAGLTPGNHSSPGSTAGGTYKCTHPGCTAAPFQTQYLLNSHANVHSQERPHFCPVPGCERGVGGKGFKRKNEMIRHGLVHNSPGYVCPFCPDQQHKYPRPDNLQRHVRVHHLDRGKDDPDLRKVLSQRPEGSNRGRRRRTHG